MQPFILSQTMIEHLTFKSGTQLTGTKDCNLCLDQLEKEVVVELINTDSLKK